MEQELQSLQKFYDVIIEFFANYSFQLVGAFIILIIGWIASKWAFRVTLKQFKKHDFDPTLSQFIANLVRILVMFGMLVVALGKVGISIAPFLAAVGALSLTAGLAIQGSVSNFAAGVTLIVTRPFKVGDTITINGVSGLVEDIHLAYTELRTEDEEIITIPNKHMIGEVLVNSFEYRIVETTVGIDYGDDIEKAIEVIEGVFESFDEVSKESKTLVGIENFGDSSVDIGVRYWVPTIDYFKTQYAVNLAIYNAVKKAGLTIPYPQRDVHLFQTAKGDRGVENTQ